MAQPTCSSFLSWSLARNLALVATFYAVGMLYFHYYLGLSILDTVHISTAALTASGPSFAPPIAARVPVVFFFIAGVCITLHILSGFIIAEVRQAKYNTRKYGTDVDNVSIRSMLNVVYINRIIIPLAHMICVILIGTFFFSANEHWSFSDALFYSVILKSSGVPKYGLEAEKFSSRVFLVIYMWVFITSLMALVSALCALRIETVELIRLEVLDNKSKNLSSLAVNAAFSTGEHIDQFEFLVRLLIHLEILNKEEDVDRWLSSIQEFSQSKNGRLSRTDIFAFADSERRKRIRRSQDAAGRAGGDVVDGADFTFSPFASPNKFRYSSVPDLPPPSVGIGLDSSPTRGHPDDSSYAIAARYLAAERSKAAVGDGDDDYDYL